MPLKRMKFEIHPRAMAIGAVTLVLWFALLKHAGALAAVLIRRHSPEVWPSESIFWYADWISFGLSVPIAAVVVRYAPRKVPAVRAIIIVRGLALLLCSLVVLNSVLLGPLGGWNGRRDSRAEAVAEWWLPLDNWSDGFSAVIVWIFDSTVCVLFVTLLIAAMSMRDLIKDRLIKLDRWVVIVALCVGVFWMFTGFLFFLSLLADFRF